MGRKTKGFTLIELMIVIAIIAIIAAIAIPGLLQSQRAANERNASASLKTIATAEADFRSNDRDGNRVNDFWTLTLSGLGTICPLGATTNTAAMAIKLIEPSIITAENSNVGATRTHSVPGGTISEVGPTNFGRLTPKAGYWYFALVNDNSVPAPELPGYNQATDGGTASIHNNTRFGMGCYPDSFSSGRQIFVVNEQNTIYKRQCIQTVRVGSANPPNAVPDPAGVANGSTVLPSDWPTELALSSNYGRTD